MPRDPDDSPSSAGDSDSSPKTPRGERLQKVLAAAGVGSRRDCETLILEGRVEVDGNVVNVLGTRVDAATQQIRVDGENLRKPKRLYFAVNKPEGVVTTNSDPSGRTRVIDLVPTQERVFAVGRLDRASEGLIIVTNDGELSERVTHPRYGVEKHYLVRIAGKLEDKELDRLRRGIHLSDGFAKVVSLRIRGAHKQSTDLEMVLNEGKNREIRRMLARVGHKVLWLKRVAIGSLKLGDLPTGEARPLSTKEVGELMAIQIRKRKPKAKPAGERPSRPDFAAAEEAPRERGPKPVGGKRPKSRYQEDQERMGRPAAAEDAFPPVDEGLQLDDFLPPTDHLGGKGKAGGVLHYGDDEFAGGESVGEERPARRPRGFAAGQGAGRPSGRGRGGPRAGTGSRDRGGPHEGMGSRDRNGPRGARPRRFNDASEGEGRPGGRPGRRPSGGRPMGNRPGFRPRRTAEGEQDLPAGGGEGAVRPRRFSPGGRPPRKFGPRPGGGAGGRPPREGGRAEGGRGERRSAGRSRSESSGPGMSGGSDGGPRGRRSGPPGRKFGGGKPGGGFGGGRGRPGNKFGRKRRPGRDR